MDKIQNLTLHKTKEYKEFVVTFKDLYESIQKDIEDYAKLGKLDELMEQKVVLNICDLEGQVIYGYATGYIGWLQDDTVLITGNLLDVHAIVDIADNK